MDQFTEREIYQIAAKIYPLLKYQYKDMGIVEGFLRQFTRYDIHIEISILDFYSLMKMRDPDQKQRIYIGYKIDEILIRNKRLMEKSHLMSWVKIK